ncbi:MAG: N-acetyltransferase [Gammaproteobacteria bacterium]|nr:N-acetyltransferase [Gammaproteobacteria bacterium]
MEIRTLSSIKEITASQWNRLMPALQPFMRYEFHAALEQHQCTGNTYGWIPKHIVAYDNEKIIGIIPTYEKYNSYGEFVFDMAWADAYHRHGFEYYPKWVSASPYTPVTGPRILTDPEYNQQTVVSSMVKYSIEQIKSHSLSSLHYLFTTKETTDQLEQLGFMTRLGCQFHWHNNNYQTFDDFLATLTAKKRKNIRQERKYAAQAKADIEIIQGNNATEEQLAAAELFYRKTFGEKYGTATLNIGFFKQIAKSMGEQFVLIMAKRNNAYIAGAICFQDDETLYGRHWGYIEDHDHLHFEVCYYQGIEYCIKNGLKHFEPGAQGEHKISRGFLPTETWSSHWIKHPDFSLAIQQFLDNETTGMRHYIKDMQSRSPYKK